MNPRTKGVMLVILAIGMVTALTLSSFSVMPTFAKKKHCDKTDTGCDTIKHKSNQKLLLGNSSSLQSDQGQNDSNMVDEPTSLDESQIRVDNSTSSTDSLSVNPFALPGM